MISTASRWTTLLITTCLAVFIAAFLAACLASCGGGSSGDSASASIDATPVVSLPRSFKAQVWADNWFSLYVGENFVGEDSVPITTERSFNAETLSFTASYPFVLNYIINDYKQNDTGLEYIGTANQQIGDGGFIMQITDTATGKNVAVSSSAVKCTVIHKAPLNTSCVTQGSPTVATCGATILGEPAGWKTAAFNASAWSNASVYTAAEVRKRRLQHDCMECISKADLDERSQG